MNITLADSVYNKLNPSDMAFVTEGPLYARLPFSVLCYPILKKKLFYWVGTHFSYYKVASSLYPKLATPRKYRYKNDATSELYDSLGTQK